MKYKAEYLSLLDKYTELKDDYDNLRKESKSLVNYILRIKKKCDSQNLWLMASHDPYKPLTAEEQQGPMVTKLFELVQNTKKRIK